MCDLPGIEVLPGDVTDGQRMRDIARGCDYVFHLVAVWRGSLAHHRAVNVEGTRNVMMAAVEAGVERIVHVSTVSVYGFRLHGGISEDAPLQPGSTPYNLTKAEGEMVVREIATRHSLPYSMIRPGNIYGPRSPIWTTALFRYTQAKLLNHRYTFWFGDGCGSAHPIYVDDVVDLLLTLATHPAARGEVFHCAPDPSPTWREFLSGYGQLAGGSRWVGVPRGTVYFPAAIAEPFLHLAEQGLALRELLRYMEQPVTYRMTKARDLLGWRPQVDLGTGILRCAPGLREQGVL